MEIVQEFPPNIEAIKKVFPLKGGEIFAWGDTIYSPSSSDLPIWLVKHEECHRAQQCIFGGSNIPDPEGWWAKYLKDPQWRFEQELEAHRVEYWWFCNRELDRNKRRVFLKGLAKRLSSPMYGKVVTFAKAKRMIKQ